MYTYKTEILTINAKAFSVMPNEKEIAEFDTLISQRSAEGWELACYDYVVTSGLMNPAFIITFKREI